MVNENQSLSALIAFDTKIANKYESQSKIIIGVDEVGRGCLAGPVVAAAVCLPKITKSSKLGKQLSELNDSKQLTANLREVLSQTLRQHAQWALGMASTEEIDEFNILNASFLAMRRAITGLIESSGLGGEILILVDGNKKIPLIAFEQIPVIKGDGLSASIASASVVAKVHRDGIMSELAKEHPEYNWHENKGYASKHHRQALDTHGPSRWHRRSFNLGQIKQLSLFVGD